MNQTKSLRMQVGIQTNQKENSIIILTIKQKKKKINVECHTLNSVKR